MCHGNAMDCLSGGRFHAARYQRRPAEQHPARVSGHMPASVKWRTLFKNEMHDQGGAFAPPSLSCFPRNPSHSSVPASQTRHFPSPPDIEIAASPFPLPGFPLSPIYSMPLIPGTVKLLRFSSLLFIQIGSARRFSLDRRQPEAESLGIGSRSEPAPEHPRGLVDENRPFPVHPLPEKTAEFLCPLLQDAGGIAGIG